MTILSVTNIAGGDKTGKTMIGSLLNTKGSFFLIDEHYEGHNHKKDVIDKLDGWKKDSINRNVVLVGQIIYMTIDYDFGNIPHYYISLNHVPAISDKAIDKESKPLFGS